MKNLTYTSCMISCLSLLIVSCTSNNQSNTKHQYHASHDNQQNLHTEINSTSSISPLTDIEQPSIWQGSERSNTGNMDFSHNKNAVPVYYFSENQSSDDIKEEKQLITLKKGMNKDSDSPHYKLQLLDENAYYGFYRRIKEMEKVENIYVYAFKKEVENLNALQDLTAQYKGHFLFATASYPNVPIKSNASIEYKNGKATGKITDRYNGEELFHIKVEEDPRKATFFPTVDTLPNSNVTLNKNTHSPDTIAMDLHFIRGSDNKENKYILGEGGNSKYWGVLGVEQQ